MKKSIAKKALNANIRPGHVIECPFCGKPMLKQIVQDNIIDVCEEHGIWLDKGEMESIVKRVEHQGFQRGFKRKHVALQQARKEGKVSGWLLGPLSFWFD